MLVPQFNHSLGWPPEALTLNLAQNSDSTMFSPVLGNADSSKDATNLTT